ncbi:MAG: SH3 domain-containing protein [Clostridia bacterium]|nr:SH3 domain-containing protein [Clostridia bacterium]
MNLKKMLVKSALIGTIMAMGASATAFAYTKGLLNDNRVNVREENSTASNVIGKLSAGDYVDILGKDGSWYNVSYDSVNSAYIHSDYIDIIETDAYITEDDIKLREEPDDTSDIIAYLDKLDEITVYAKSGNWYYADFDGEKGYVFADYVVGDYLDDIQTEVDDSDLEKYAVIIAETGLNLRDEPSLEGNVIDILRLGTTADVIREEGEWVLVEAPDGTEGYVNAEFITIRTGSKDEVSGLGKTIIDFAEQYMGTPYKWGGTNLNSGVDCSGFVYAVYRNFGIALNRSSAAMEAYDGYYISKGELQAGDLVFFDNDGNGTIDHVGIYMHDGYYIHSSSGKTTGVIISNLYDSYSSKVYASAKRVID